MRGNRSWKRWAVVAGVVAAGLVGGGIAIAGAMGDDRPLTGDALEKAAAAALDHTGGGEVIETEVGDDGAAYGVEVLLPGGGVVEVHLDEAFNVIGREHDEDRPDERDGAGED